MPARSSTARSRLNCQQSNAAALHRSPVLRDAAGSVLPHPGCSVFPRPPRLGLPGGEPWPPSVSTRASPDADEGGAGEHPDQWLPGDGSQHHRCDGEEPDVLGDAGLEHAGVTAAKTPLGNCLQNPQRLDCGESLCLGEQRPGGGSCSARSNLWSRSTRRT